VDGDDPSNDASKNEDGDGEQSLRKSFAEDMRISVAIETNDAGNFGLVAKVDQIVATAEKLIEISGELAVGRIFADGGQVGSSLAIQ